MHKITRKRETEVADWETKSICTKMKGLICFGTYPNLTSEL